MSRLPIVTPREMVAVLKKLGFIEHHQTGSHLYLLNPVSKRMTSVPMHARDLKRGTMRAILEQAGITDDAFLEKL